MRSMCPSKREVFQAASLCASIDVCASQVPSSRNRHALLLLLRPGGRTTYHLYRNDVKIATFNIIDEEVSSVFKKEVIPKYVDSISIAPYEAYNINQDLVINFSDDTTEIKICSL